MVDSSLPMDRHRTVTDVVLLALWTLGYALIAQAFSLMLHLEGNRGRRAAAGR